MVGTPHFQVTALAPHGILYRAIDNAPQSTNTTIANGIEAIACDAPGCAVTARRSFLGDGGETEGRRSTARALTSSCRPNTRPLHLPRPRGGRGRRRGTWCGRRRSVGPAVRDHPRVACHLVQRHPTVRVLLQQLSAQHTGNTTSVSHGARAGHRTPSPLHLQAPRCTPWK